MKILFIVLFACNVLTYYEVNDRQVGVQLFQWTFSDIEIECQTFLKEKGYSYVQTSPVQPHIRNNFDGNEYPWYLTYQPLAFSIGNRLGDEEQFVSMVETCKGAGVDIVVDVVLNHFAGVNSEDTVGFGSRLPWSSREYHESFPEEGFDATDFHDKECSGPIDFEDDQSIWKCRLLGLVDLATETTYVRNKIIAFLNKLLEIGAVGFRVDAAKHIAPEDLQFIFNSLRNNYRGNRPFIANEVWGSFSDGTYKNYGDLGRLLNFDYALGIGKAFHRNMKDTIKVIEDLVISPGESCTFIENHDIERSFDEDYILSTRSTRLYKLAIAFNILYPYGIPIVHSGYSFEKSFESAPYLYDGYLKSQKNRKCRTDPWLCQHRYAHVYPLVIIRNYIGSPRTLPKLTAVNDNVITWNIKGRLFVVLSKSELRNSFHTNLSPGVYCNLAYSFSNGRECVMWPEVILSNDEQIQYSVDERGWVHVNIQQDDYSGVLVLSSHQMGVVKKTIKLRVK